MGWEYGPGGYRVWIDPKTGKPGKPPAGSTERQDRRERGGNDSKGSGTNVWGGPKGTKKDAAGRGYSDPRHARFGPQPQSSRDRAANGPRANQGGAGAGGKKGQTGPSPAEVAAAEAAARKAVEVSERLKAQAARQARIEAAKNKAQLRAARRLNKMEKAILERQRAAVAKLNANNAAAMQLRNEADQLAAQGRIEEARAKQREADLLENNNMEVRRDLIDAQQGVNRAQANEQLNEISKKAGQPLTPEQKRQRNQNKKIRRDIIESSTIPSLARLQYGDVRPGDAGYAKAIQRARKDVELYFNEHPEAYDPEVVSFLGLRLDKHTGSLNAQNEEIIDEADRLVQVINENPKSKAARRAFARLQKIEAEYKENLQGLQRELDVLYGKEVKTLPDGTVVRRKNSGLVNDYIKMADRLHEANMTYQLETIYGPGVTKEIRGYIEDETAHILWNEASKSVHEITLPNGETRLQTPTERLNEMVATGEMTREQALTIGQQRLTDYAAAARDWADDPELRYVLPYLAASDIRKNEEVDDYDMVVIERSIIGPSVDDAHAAWLAGPNAKPPGVDAGIYNEGQYGRDANGEQYFVLNDGSIVYPGDPLPQGHPEPKWGFGEGGIGPILRRRTLSEWEDHDTQGYVTVNKQRIEDKIRNAFGVSDQGFIGDLQNAPVTGPVLEAFGILSGGIGTTDFMFPGDIGFDFSNTYLESILGRGEYVPSIYRETVFNEETGTDELKWDPNEYWVVDATGNTDLLDSYGGLPEAVEMVVGQEIHVVIPKDEGGPVAGSLVFTIPTGGLVEVGFDWSPEARERETARREAGLEALKSGDFMLFGRVVTDVGIVPVQFGGAAGVINFAAEMMYDPTNIIPFGAVGKAGLRGLRAVRSASKTLPPGANAVSKLAHIVDAFRGAAVIDPLAVEVHEIFDFIRKLAPDLPEEQIQGAFKAALANVDTSLKGDALIDNITKNIADKLGFGPNSGKDLTVIRNWAQTEAAKVMRHRGWIVHSQADGLARTVEIVRLQNEARLAEGIALTQRRMDRNARVISDMEAVGKRARERTTMGRAESEAFEREALELADNTPLERLEELAVQQGIPPERQAVFMRARDLARERAGIVEGQVVVEGATRGGRVNLEDMKFEGAKRKPRKGTPEYEEARRLENERIRKEKAARREERLAKRREQREIESRNRAAKVAGSDVRQPSPAIRQARTLARDSGVVLDEAPASWANPTGPNFWVDTLTSRPSGSSTATASVASQFVDAVAKRFGRWDTSVPAVKAVVNRGVKRVLTTGPDTTENMRLLYAAYLRRLDGFPEGWRIRRSGDSIYDPETGEVISLLDPDVEAPSFAQFQEMWANRGGREAVSVFGPEIGPAYDELIALGRLAPEDAFEAQLHLLAQIQFNPTAGARHALGYLDNAARLGIDFQESRDLLRALFKDEIDTFWARLQKEALDPRGTEYEDILDSDLYRLAQRLDGDPPTPRPIDPKLAPPRNPVQMLGYEGFDIERSVGRVLQNPGDVGAVQEVARVLTLAHVTSDQWGAIQKVARSLGRAHSKSAAGRAAKAIREQMHKELDALGLKFGDDGALIGSASDVGPQGPSPQLVAAEQHAAFFNEMGQSETAWLSTRLKRNTARINNRATTKGEREYLLKQNDDIKAALEDIRVRKDGGTYEPPRISKNDAIRKANEVRERVKGIIPPRVHAFYAKTKAAANVELARSVRVAAKKNIVKKGIKNADLEDDLNNFPLERYQELNDFVGERIRAVQGRRESSLGLRRPPSDDLPDETLRSITDEHPEILAAKNAAIDEWCAANGIQRIRTASYDRIRTLLQPHIQRKIRTDLLLDNVGEGANFSEEAFLAARRAATDQDAVDNIAWMLRKNPGMTVDEAVRQLELGYLTDGKLRSGAKEITETDYRVLSEYFRVLTGADIDDVPAVKVALQAEDTKPPFDKKYSFRAHQERTGEWSPRDLDQIDESRPPWSIDEERAWFEMRYGEAPMWVSDPRFAHDGAAFHGSHHQHLEILRETGNFDERLRVAAQLGDEGDISLEDMVHGDVSRSIKPVKDVEQERLFAVSRYGDRVGTIDDQGNITLHAMPWLMTRDEYVTYTMSGLGDASKLFSPDEVDEVIGAIGRLAEKYVDQFEAALRLDPEMKIVPSSLPNEFAYYMMLELSQSAPWESFLRKAANNGGHAWTAAWVGMVTGNPGWIASNVVDQTSKSVAFLGTNPFARRGMKKIVTGQPNRGRELVPSLKSIGVENSGILGEVKESRSIRARLSPKTTWGTTDRIGAVWDMFTFKPISQKLVKEFSDEMPKLKVAQAMAADMDVTLRPVLKAKGLGDETIDLAIRYRVKKNIERLYPSLANRTYTEKLLNKIFPFISYNARNRVLWLGFTLDHPWLVYMQQQIQGGLVEYNRREYAKKYPGYLIPEHLMHEVRVPGTDIYINIGDYTDYARGADLIMGGEPITISDLQRAFLRPLPAQQSLFKNLGWNLFGAFGRQAYVKVFNEDGSWTPGNYETVILPPGTNWGADPLNYATDFFWPASVWNAVQKGMEDGEWDYQDTVRVFGSIASFGEWAEPSRYYFANQQYHALHDVDPQLAYDWLDESPEGQWLRQQWNAQFYKPSRTKVDPFVLQNAAAMDELAKSGLPEFLIDGYPDPLELRKQWFNLQSPEYKEMLQDAWKELGAANEYWDSIIANADPKDIERLKGIRRAWYAQFYHSKPYVWQYIGMGMTPAEFDSEILKIHLEDQRNLFFSMYGWEHKPEDEKEAKIWEKSREKYLKQNPAVAESLRQDMSDFDRAREAVNESWDKSFGALRRLEATQDALREAGMWDEAEALDGLRDIFDSTFEIEAFGRENGVWKSSADLLTLRLRKAAGDAKATAEVWYGARMEAVMKEAGGSRSKWFRIMEQNKDLLQMYWDKNPDKKASWKYDKYSASFWERFSRLADKGNWDAAWAAWDESPEWFKQRYREQNPQKWRKFEQSSRYSLYMKTWVGLFEAGKNKEAMDYFWSLPQWARDRYYANNPGSRLSSGQGKEYVSSLNKVFDLIDAGNWDAAEKYWNSLPAWVRNRYYSNNPDSKLFRGGSGGGGIPDAKYKKYVRAMKKWVDLQRDGEQAKADAYFRSLPKWMQDFYLKRHPDKAMLKESLKMQTLLEEYLTANKAHQEAILANNPAFAKWLNQNDTKAERTNAILFVYSRIEDPWLKRVFREKYPDIFSKEAQGAAKKAQIQDILKEYPEFRPAWRKWRDDIYETLAEAMKYEQARPRSGEGADYSYVHQRPHGLSMSAADVAASIDEAIARSPQVTKRMPRYA